MIYCVLSAPCVYISCYYRNVQGAACSRRLWSVPTPGVHSPTTGLVRPALHHTIGAVIGVCRGKDKPYFDNTSLIDYDSNQVSCRFSDLFKGWKLFVHPPPPLLWITIHAPMLKLPQNIVGPSFSMAKTVSASPFL